MGYPMFYSSKNFEFKSVLTNIYNISIRDFEVGIYDANAKIFKFGKKYFTADELQELCSAAKGIEEYYLRNTDF